jgi:hypothetical protein
MRALNLHATGACSTAITCTPYFYLSFLVGAFCTGWCCCHTKHSARHCTELHHSCRATHHQLRPPPLHWEHSAGAHTTLCRGQGGTWQLQLCGLPQLPQPTTHCPTHPHPLTSTHAHIGIHRYTQARCAHHSPSIHSWITHCCRPQASEACSHLLILQSPRRQLRRCTSQIPQSTDNSMAPPGVLQSSPS